MSPRTRAQRKPGRRLVQTLLFSSAPTALVALMAATAAFAPGARAADYVVFEQADDPDAPLIGSLRRAVDQLNAQTNETNFIYFDLPNPQPVVLQDALEGIERNVELVADPFFITSVREFDPDAETEFDILRVSKNTTVLDDVIFSGGDFVVGIDPVEGADAVLVFRYSEDVVVEVEDDIHGLGGLAKEGLGDLFLSGINDFDGILDVIEGRVIVDEEGLPGDAAVAEDALLRFDKFDSNLEGEDELTPESYAGTITGDGLVQKAGPHDLVLDTAARFDQLGGTEVLEGRLVAEPISLPGDVEIARDAFLQLDVDAGIDAWAGSASGSGTLEKIGGGTLVLDGTNRNDGGIDVQAGFVQGAAGNLSDGLTLATATAVVFEQPVDASYAGQISGEGGVIKQGNGTLTLTAGNSWLGGTNIDAGRLRGSVSAIPGNVAIAAGASLELVESGSATFTNQLSGAGDLVKTGTGTLILPNSQPGLAGGTFVEAGTLEFQNGALLPGALTIEAGASASGVGAANGLTDIQGRMQPGDGLGTRFLAQGGALLGANSILDVQVQHSGGTSSESLLEVSGTTTTFGGAVDVEVGSGDYALAQTFDVLTSTAGITENGAFSLTPIYAFVDVSVDVVAGSGPGVNPQVLRVTVVESGENAVAFAQTMNQEQVALALDEMLAPGNGEPSVTQVRESLASVTAAEVPEVLDQMSAASLSDLLNQRLEASRRFSRAVSRRFTAGRFEDSPPRPPRRAPRPVLVGPPSEAEILEPAASDDAGAGPEESSMPLRDTLDDAPDDTPDAAPGKAADALPPVSAPRAPLRDPVGSLGGWGLWFDAFGVFGRIDGGSETDDVKTRLFGGSVGVDYRNRDGQWLPKGQQLRIGGAFDYTRAAPFGVDGATRSEADIYQVAAHASWTGGHFYAGTVGLYGYADGTTSRSIDFGDIDEIASGQVTGQQGGVYAEAGARFGFGERMVAQPWIGFEWARVTQSAYTEEGALALDLEVDSAEADSLQSFVGARLSALLDLSNRYGMEPELRVGWAHQFASVGRSIDARFTGALVGADFSSIGAETARDQLLLGAGYTMRVAPGVALALDWDARFFGQQQTQAISTSIYVQW